MKENLDFVYIYQPVTFLISENSGFHLFICHDHSLYFYSLKFLRPFYVGTLIFLRTKGEKEKKMES